MEEEKLYFTEITESEKRIINLIRAFIAPCEPISQYIDFLVDDLIKRFMEKATYHLAFTEVLQHERDNKEVSNIQLMARAMQYKEYIERDECTTNRIVNGLLTDVVSKLEGDILPIQVYSQKDMVDEEEKILDKIQ